MNTWATVLIASALAYASKLLGYLVPARWLAGERTTVLTALIPTALLSALVAVQTFAGDDGALVVDARAVALAVAAVLLWRRAPFLVVIVVAAAVAAALRAVHVMT